MTTLRVTYLQASCNLDEYFNTIYLSCLDVKYEYRGKGLAKRVLRISKRVAVIKGKKLCLSAGPYNRCPLTLEQLIEWYKKQGFVSEEPHKPWALTYYPKQRRSK
jgi:ribosomal protein S18 acetylase RimI-like enzyme